MFNAITLTVTKQLSLRILKLRRKWEKSNLLHVRYKYIIDTGNLCESAEICGT